MNYYFKGKTLYIKKGFFWYFCENFDYENTMNEFHLLLPKFVNGTLLILTMLFTIPLYVILVILNCLNFSYVKQISKKMFEIWNPSTFKNFLMLPKDSMSMNFSSEFSLNKFINTEEIAEHIPELRL